MRLPRTVKLLARGIDVDAHGEAMHVYLADGQLEAYRRQREIVRRTFGIGKRTLAKKAAKKSGLPQYGIVGPALFRELEEAGAYEGRPAKLLTEYLRGQNSPRAPRLGPVIPGGLTILRHDLTHRTDGLNDPRSFFPAFDEGHAGLPVIAPEPLEITYIGRAVRRDGHPNGRSVHATGKSGIRYWIGHVENPAPAGTRVKTGKPFAVISSNHEAPHVHVGIDATAVLGHDLAHHVNYTHGAPTVGDQFALT